MDSVWQNFTGKTLTSVHPGYEIHQRIPLEWCHLFVKNPNRKENLFGAYNSVHYTITTEWNAWRQSIIDSGRTIASVTPAEVEAKAQLIDSAATFARSAWIPLP